MSAVRWQCRRWQKKKIRSTPHILSVIMTQHLQGIHYMPWWWSAHYATHHSADKWGIRYTFVRYVYFELWLMTTKTKHVPDNSLFLPCMKTNVNALLPAKPQWHGKSSSQSRSGEGLRSCRSGEGLRSCSITAAALMKYWGLVKVQRDRSASKQIQK